MDTKNQSGDIKIEDNLLPIDFSKGIHFDQDGNIKRDNGIIKDCYVCVRPGNKQNVPKVYLESIGDRIISNNYGHGGVGWSTVWGSVMKSIQFVENTNNVILTGNKIAVIGAGCIGCATVLMLINKGVEPSNIEIFCEKMDDLTSHRSGAILSTASVLEEVDPKLKILFDDINIDSYLIWDKIFKGELFQKLKHAILKIKAYFGAEKEWGTIMTDSGLDLFVEKRIIPPPETVYVKFENRLNLMKKYDSFYFNTYKMMKSFYDIIVNFYKIKVNMGRINSFDEIDSSFKSIFNCSGLGNMDTIKKDSDIIPIGGHIVTLKNQDIYKYNYAIYSHYIYKEDIGKYKYHEAPLFYFMVKTDDETFTGLLGGSLINNYSGGDEKLDEIEYKGILRRTLEIFGQDSSKLVETKILPKI